MKRAETFFAMKLHDIFEKMQAGHLQRLVCACGLSSGRGTAECAVRRTEGCGKGCKALSERRQGLDAFGRNK